MESTATIVRVKDSDLRLADGAVDVRGHAVIDPQGSEIGEVAALLIDEEARKVRFLEVKSGSFLGLGGERRLLPVDAITRVDDDRVHVGPAREHVGASPAYDPEIADEQFYGDVYGYYGYAPYWAAGDPNPARYVR